MIMAALQSHALLSSSYRLAPCFEGRRRGRIHASLSTKNRPQSFPCLEEVTLTAKTINKNRDCDNNIIITKLFSIAEAAADRAEMHAIIGEQRNNWNHLFLHSINSINLTACLLASISGSEAKFTSAILFTSAAGLMLLVNKIQPSQLAEEQRNAARLFKQLERSIHTILRLESSVNEWDVEEAMEKMLALQNAYPLPLLPGMLEKFPKLVEPTSWWPKQRKQRRRKQMSGENGWSKEMEEEMRGVLKVLKAKDEEEYIRIGNFVLSINKFLAFAGPLLAGVAAAGAIASIGGGRGSWAAIVGGALAAVVNTVEHGGQVGMIFELLRNCAGFYLRLEEEIEFNLKEEEGMRENGEIFEIKMALQLGRSLSEIKQLAVYSSTFSADVEIKEFAGKLF